MGIDWFTLVAQVVNFLILLALLWRFLFKPVMRAMDRREEKIASRLEEAEAKEREAEEEREKLRRKREELEQHERGERDRIRREAEEEKKTLLKKAREEAEESRSRWFRAVEEEKSGLLRDVRRRAGEQLCASLERALRDLAGEELENQAIEVFLRRLSGQEGSPGVEIERLSGEDGRGLVVRTARPLSGEDRERLEKALQDRLDREVQFEEDPDLVCGIEIRTEGHKLGWSVRSYLERFERNLLEALESSESRGGEDTGAAEEAEESHEAD